jgi:hypothetical protein
MTPDESSNRVRFAVRRRWRLAMNAALLAALPAQAQAQVAERPRAAVGDRWEFVAYGTVPSRIPNRTWLVTSIGSGRVFGTENGEPLALTDELNVVDSPRHSESNPKQLSFPLEVGKRWRYVSEWLFKAKSSRGTVAFDVSVVGYEPVHVPGGTFDAFKLVAIGELGGTSPVNSIYAGRMTVTYWYSPEARAIVRSVRHNPYLGTETVELVTFELRR